MRDPEKRYHSMVRKLKETGRRITPQRLAILKIVAESTEHPSAESIFEQVKVQFTTTSMATVYKTLAVLKETGEVLELGFSNDYNRYDGNQPAPHPHLICIKCKGIVDPDPRSLVEITQKLASETGYEIIGFRVDLYGLCPGCRKRKV
ncbi:MAG: Fur family transcriptional regulator [Syntrophobacteraceae bacterium]